MSSLILRSESPGCLLDHVPTHVMIDSSALDQINRSLAAGSGPWSYKVAVIKPLFKRHPDPDGRSHKLLRDTSITSSL